MITVEIDEQKNIENLSVKTQALRCEKKKIQIPLACSLKEMDVYDSTENENPTGFSKLQF